MGDVPFIVGIQTPWMREMMVKHSHNSIIAIDLTFSTNKYGVSIEMLTIFIDFIFYSFICFISINYFLKVEIMCSTNYIHYLF